MRKWMPNWIAIEKYKKKNKKIYQRISILEIERLVNFYGKGSRVLSIVILVTCRLNLLITFFPKSE